MKKIMMGASALAIASLAGAAGAQEWSVRTSGGAVAGFAYIDSDTAEHETAVITRTDLTVNARLVADNGLTFGSSLTLLATGDDDIVQDGYDASVSGSFGRVRVGLFSGPQRSLLARTPRTTFAGAGRSAGILFDGAYNRDDTPSQGIQDDRGVSSGFTRKIEYTTPTFSGFRAGIAYAPNSTVNRNASTGIAAPRPGEALEMGANYTGNFGDFSLAVGGGYTYFFNDGAAFDDGYAIGAEVGFGGFAFGVSYGGGSGNGAAADVGMIAVGARYRTGPWSFGASYGINLEGPTNTSRNAEDDYGLSLAADYALAPGVVVGAQFEYSDSDRTRTVGRNSGTDAFALGVLMGLSF
jgi:hypothetical protein